jgi:hypothetical protein
MSTTWHRHFVSATKHPADEKAELIADIRRRLSFVAIEHPGLAMEIERAMDMVEDKRGLPVKFLADDQSRLAVGVEVILPGNDRYPDRQGIIVQMGDEDVRPGCVLVWQGVDSEYPGWWSADYVVPLSKANRHSQPVDAGASGEGEEQR